MAKLTLNNPFDKHILYHYKLAFDYIPNKKYIHILDFGCGDGDFAEVLTSKAPYVYGYDVIDKPFNKELKLSKKVHFTLGKPEEKLPYKDNLFDIVTMFHVIEHVVDEETTIKEIHRILKKDGKLILAAPYKGLLTWMDLANIRYISPGIHKILFSLLFGNKSYKKIYKNASGIYSDSSSNRSWHKHYLEEEIGKLQKKFTIEKFYKFSLFHPILNMLNIIDAAVRKKNFLPVNKVLELLFYVDNRINAGDYSYNFMVIARKK